MNAKVFLRMPLSDTPVPVGSPLESDLGPLRGSPLDEKSDAVLGLGELLEATVESIRPHIQSDSTIRLEVKGSVTRTGKGSLGASAYVINVGLSGEHERVDSVTIIIETAVHV